MQRVRGEIRFENINWVQRLDSAQYCKIDPAISAAAAIFAIGMIPPRGGGSDNDQILKAESGLVGGGRWEVGIPSWL